jgi:hypothetical protein
MRDNEDRLGALVQTDAPVAQVPVQTTQNSPLSFVAPTEFVDLPSKGQLYPEGHPLKGKDKVEIKFMTAKEEDILTSRSLIKKGVAIDRMLESLLVDRAIKVENLLLGDKNALIVGARISGYGASYKTNITCPSCGVNCKHDFDLEKLTHVKADNLEDLGVTLTNNNTFTFNLPKTKATVEVRPLTGKDELELSELIEKKKKANLPEESSTSQMKTYLVSVNGNRDKNVIKQFVDNLPALDARQMRLIYRQIVPNVDMTQQFICSSCAFEQDMEVPFTVDFFWPK